MKFLLFASFLAVNSAYPCMLTTLSGCTIESGCTWCTTSMNPKGFCYNIADANAIKQKQKQRNKNYPLIYMMKCKTKTKGRGRFLQSLPTHRSEVLSRKETENLGVVWRGNSSDFNALPSKPKRRNEIFSREETEKLGVVWRGNSSKTDSHALLSTPASYPDSFSWCNKDGKNHCTMSRNQHIPQYCGSCWAHGTISALGDRVKIARKADGIDVNLAVQHVLNCGGVGSCYGGSVDGAYQWIKNISDATGSGVSYETSNPYIACSSDSKEGFCGQVDTTCTPANVARTCGSFDKEGGGCSGLSHYPNVTIAEYGSISGRAAMMKEIFARGPIACGIDATSLLNFETGIIADPGQSIDHVISIVGWGMHAKTKQQYWIVRNSWGEYWGDIGYVNVAFGALQIEQQCTWAVPGSFTAVELNNQKHCHEGGDNCKASTSTSDVVV